MGSNENVSVFNISIIQCNNKNAPIVRYKLENSVVYFKSKQIQYVQCSLICLMN